MAVKGPGRTKRGPTTHLRKLYDQWQVPRKEEQNSPEEARAAPEEMEYADKPTEVTELPSLGALHAWKRRIEATLATARAEGREEVEELEERLEETNTRILDASARAKQQALERLRRDCANRTR